MKKVLVVDDHDDIRRLLKITLGRHFQICEAEDGSHALALVHSEHPDLVVLDVMMPGAIDGIGVLDAIRSDIKLIDTKVVLVTARGQADDCETGLAHGADAYFVKPFSPLQLEQRVRELLQV